MGVLNRVLLEFYQISHDQSTQSTIA